MTTPFIFDYNQFYDYYKNAANLSVDKKPPITYYYLRHNDKLFANYRLKHYITIDNKRYYVTTTRDRVMFTFPQLIDGKYWDFHYHFGINPGFKYERRIAPAIGPYKFQQKKRNIAIIVIF